MTRFSLTSTAAAALLALSLPAAAAPFTVTQQSANVHGSYGSGSMTLTGVSGAVSAGAFAVKADEFGGDFAAWCLDLAHTLKLPSNYEITATPFIGSPISAAVQSTVKALFDTAYSGLNMSNTAQSAGFQLALWEILTETKTKYGQPVYNVSSGNFYATGTTNSVINAANGFLGGLKGTKTGDYTLTFLQSTDGRQSLVTVAAPVPPDTPAPVPLPAAGLLLFGALGGLGVVARRRKSTDA